MEMEIEIEMEMEMEIDMDIDEGTMPIFVRDEDGDDFEFDMADVDEFDPMFEGFRDIEIQVSIDAIGDLGSTIRMKQPWDKIDNNIRAMNDLYNVTMLHATVSIMNINKMQDFLDYCHELDIEESMSMLHGPNYLRLNIIPREFRMQWFTDNEKVNTWLMIPNHKDIKDQGRLFLRSIPLLDSESEFNFRDINPEIVDIVEKYVV